MPVALPLAVTMHHAAGRSVASRLAELARFCVSPGHRPLRRRSGVGSPTAAAQTLQSAPGHAMPGARAPRGRGQLSLSRRLHPSLRSHHLARCRQSLSPTRTDSRERWVEDTGGAVASASRRHPLRHARALASTLDLGTAAAADIALTGGGHD
ncbi:hypothetical protein AURDEDRAFT_173495 [Auricularia subglabra TFB-10046 SS5]|nr:hypothetical protein AURDEDRAFT_173495 [Auricularia subglabra TFB-10046 SS5]